MGDYPDRDQAIRMFIYLKTTLNNFDMYVEKILNYPIENNNTFNILGNILWAEKRKGLIILPNRW